MKIPIYNIVIDLYDDETGMGAISFVADPAIESNFICFDKDSKPMMFKVENEMEHKVTGCAIWCNKQIYRYDPTIGEYYVVFSKETIDKIVQKYAKQGLNNLVDLQHDGQMVDGVVMVEYFIKDTAKGINPKGFEDIDDGSLFVTYKIEDEKLWNEIIAPDSEFKGFSIEINADIVPTNEYVEEEIDDDFMNWLDELLKALENADCEIEFESSKKKVETDDWDLGFSIERTDILPLVNNKKSAIIDGTEYWVHSVGKERSKDIAICYDPKKHKYLVLPLDNIKQFEPTNHAIGQFPDLPKSITDNDDISVQRSVNSSSYADLMHNRTVVMLSYDDELPQPHTGYRQCAIVAWGETKRGNECLRIYEMYGDSRSAADGTGFIPDYRLILTRRIKAFKPMFNTQPWGIDLLDSRYNWFGDNSMSVCYDHVTEADF